MAYSKTKKILFILLCLIIIIFPFWCVRGLCAETETIEPITYNDLAYNLERNYFFTSPGTAIYCYHIEPGYYYNFFNDTTSNRSLILSSEEPAPNVTYTFLTALQTGQNYSYIGEGYIFITSATNTLTVTREKISGMNTTIDDLVENVGINSIWNIFDISINYIVVVILFAFGCFIIFKIIKKISRGKEGL